MSTFNSFSIVGRLCKDATVKEVKNSNLARFGIFVDGKPAAEGQEKEPSAILGIEKFCKKEDTKVIETLKKGKLVKVEGFFQANSYKNKDGKVITNVVLKATSVEPFEFPKKEEKKEEA